MKGRKGRDQRSYIADLASQRIHRLFEQAEAAYPDRPDLADRYVGLARRISMRHRVGIPRELKRSVCKHCYAYLRPGSSARVRTDGRNVIITCLRCGGVRRYPYKTRPARGDKHQ